MTPGHRLVAAVSGGLVVAVAAACGGSGYQFVENADHGVYAKVPDDWAIYDGEQVLDIDESDGLQWFRGFDASDAPSPEGTTELGAAEPRGFVRIRQLTREQRDLVNVSALRSVVLQVDPLSPTGMSLPGAEVEVLLDEPAEFDGGYHGVHSVFAASVGDRVAIIDQTVVLDATSSVLYEFVVSCDEDCYFETSKDEVAEIVDSWTIEEERS